MYLEAVGDRLFSVPVEEAKRRAVVVLTEKLRQAGRVNMDYIKAVTAEKLVVAGYRVNLRASLSGNLDLMLEDVAGAAAQPAMDAVDPAAGRIVLFMRGPSTPAVERLMATAKEHGVEVITHPVAADKALKFGLGSDWQRSAGDDAMAAAIDD